jgi:phosphatidylethanolamine/phosphatidyl-N-methylethanolamine N-methyltransferase
VKEISASLQRYFRLSIAAAQRQRVPVFLREVVRNPGFVGAVWPSFAPLARKMASLVPHDLDGYVVELGAGTGNITHELLAAGISAERLIIVERSTEFVAVLRKRFPGVRVVRGDAAVLSTLLPPQAVVAAVVSSLPLRSLPPAVAEAIMDQWLRVLAPKGRVVQFTYSWFSSPQRWASRFSVCASSMVWANVPPARVLALEIERL